MLLGHTQGTSLPTVCQVDQMFFDAERMTWFRCINVDTWTIMNNVTTSTDAYTVTSTSISYLNYYIFGLLIAFCVNSVAYIMEYNSSEDKGRYILHLLVIMVCSTALSRCVIEILKTEFAK